MKSATGILMRLCGAAVAGFALSAAMCQAVTLRTNTVFVAFPSANLTSYASGMSTWGGGADMAIDKAGNPHIVNAAGDPGHTGFLQYRRWSRSSTNWSGPIVTLEGTSVEDDNFYPAITVDDADRVHVVYFHRLSTVTNVYEPYHAWCTNASGASPLTSNKRNGAEAAGRGARWASRRATG